MKKVIKTLAAVLGVTVIGSIVIKEKNAINDLRKRLFDMRWCEPKNECKK